MGAGAAGGQTEEDDGGDRDWLKEEEDSVQRAGGCLRIADCGGRTAECGLQTAGWWSATVDCGQKD